LLKVTLFTLMASDKSRFNTTSENDLSDKQ